MNTFTTLSKIMSTGVVNDSIYVDPPKNTTDPRAQYDVVLRLFIPMKEFSAIVRTSRANKVYSIKKAIIEKWMSNIDGALNYGLFMDGDGTKSGKFLQEDRVIDDYCLNSELSLKFVVFHRNGCYPPLSAKLMKINSEKNRKNLIDAIKANNIHKMSGLLQKGLDPNFNDRSGISPLCVATLRDNSEAIKVLLENGALVNFRSSNPNIGCDSGCHAGWFSPVHLCAKDNRLSALQRLLIYGASCSIDDSQNVEPLFYAVSKNNFDVTKLILTWSAVHGNSKGGRLNIDFQDEYHNRTALHEACINGSPEIVELLLKHRASVHCETPTGNTPLLSLATNVNFNAEIKRCVDLLINYGADFRRRNLAGQTARDVASLMGNHKLRDYLKKVKPEIIVEPPSFAEIHEAAKKDWNVLKKLLDSGAILLRLSDLPQGSLSSLHSISRSLQEIPFENPSVEGSASNLIAKNDKLPAKTSGTKRLSSFNSLNGIIKPKKSAHLRKEGLDDDSDNVESDFDEEDFEKSPVQRKLELIDKDAEKYEKKIQRLKAELADYEK